MNKLLIRKISALLFVTGLGFFLKYYSGNFQDLLNNSLAGAAYVTFWIIITSIFLPGVTPVKISLIVTVITAILEFVQLIDTPILDCLRKFWLGKTLLGTTFTWTDFPYYIAGGILGYLILVLLNKQISRENR